MAAPSILKKTNMAPSVSKSLNVSFDIPSQNSDLIQYLKCMSLNESDSKLNTFLKVLSAMDTEDDVLINWLKQLKDNISLLHKENERIVAALLDMKWTFRSNEVAATYQELMLNLVSAHTCYLNSVLVMLIKIFVSDRWDMDHKIIVESESYQKAHALLQNIVALIPSAPELIYQCLFIMFPYFRKPTHQIVQFSENALNITRYMPTYRKKVLEILIDKFLQIDVHCPRDVIEHWESEKERQDNKIIVPDVEIETSDEMAYVFARTLDGVMLSLFNYIQSVCYTSDGKLQWQATRKLYREFLTIFDKLILPTHLCCHVQFVMFYMCSMHHDLREGFTDYLWKKVKDPSAASIRRQSAAFYISSLLARATYISINDVVVCLEMMSSWIHSYISNHDSLSNCDIGAHGPFYSVCQAMFYIFAFRHKEFIAMKNGSKHLRGLNFERIVTCRLNPLKFCQSIIVQNFASVARNYQIAYCYPVIERNNRSLMQSGAAASLSTFFPFDPYILKKSKSYIKDIYRLYIPHEDDDSMEQEDDDSCCETTDALFSYSSSPGFKQSYVLQR